MTTYAFDSQLVADPVTLQIAANASVAVYDSADTGNTTPLTLTDLNGLPLGNPLTSTAQGFIPAFQTTSSQVKLVGGGLTVLASSYQGLKSDADAAKSFVQGIGVAATNTAATGSPAAVSIDSNGQMTFTIPAGPQGPQGADGSNVLPTDTAVANTIADGTSATRAKLNGVVGVSSALASLSLPGSPKTGNIRQGTASATVSGSAHNAFPGLAVCKDGQLLTVWRSATNHSPSVGVLKARKYKTNLAAVAGEYTILTDPTYDLRDPMLTVLTDGTIVVQFFKYDTAALNGVGVYIATSTDNGATFGVPIKVPFTWDTASCSSSALVVAPNGDWLVPAYGRTSATYYQIRLLRSSDRGATWSGEVTVASGQAASQNFQEPVIGLLPDGSTLMCLIRVANSDGTSPAIYSCTSTDNGNTWTAAVSAIAGEAARPAWLSLASGGVTVATRNATAPYPMQYFTSWDNGATWSSTLQLGPTPASQGTYAQLVEIAPGLIAAAYAIETSNTSSTVYLAYLADGYGYSPAKDDFTDPDGILIKWAGEGMSVGGASAASQLMGWPIWTLTKGAGDQCGFAFRVPASWRTYNIDLLWVNTAGGAVGNVCFRYDYEQVDVNGTLTAAAGMTVAVATGNQYILTATPYATGVARTSPLLRVKPTRLGTNGLDTYASSVGVVGVRLTRTA